MPPAFGSAIIPQEVRVDTNLLVQSGLIQPATLLNQVAVCDGSRGRLPSRFGDQSRGSVDTQSLEMSTEPGKREGASPPPPSLRDSRPQDVFKYMLRLAGSSDRTNSY